MVWHGGSPLQGAAFGLSLLLLLASHTAYGQSKNYAPGLDYWCTYLPPVVNLAHPSSLTCNNVPVPPTTAGVWSQCVTTDAYWTRVDKCVLPGLPVGPASNLPWNIGVYNLCQSQLPGRAVLYDNAANPYGYVYFSTDYSLINIITIALDGLPASQPLYKYSDPTNYVRLFINSFQNFQLNPTVNFQYNSTYSWLTQLVAPDPFSCATIAVGLANICNPLTSVYFPNASTLAPVQQGGNFGCLCMNGLGQGAAACPTLDLSKPGTVIVMSVQISVGIYTNVLTGCNGNNGNTVLGMNPFQYVVPNCNVPMPPAPPPPPPKPLPPVPPVPPPSPSPPPFPPPSPPLPSPPPLPFPPPFPPSPPTSALTSSIRFTSYSKMFNQAADCNTLNSYLLYYTSGRGWSTTCSTGITTTGTSTLGTITYTIFTTDPTGITGMQYIYLSISDPNSNWWSTVAGALNVGCTGVGSYQDQASLLVPPVYNPPRNNYLCASGVAPYDGCSYSLGPLFTCPFPPPTPPQPPNPPNPSPPAPPPAPPAPSPPRPPPPTPPSPSPPNLPPPTPPSPPPPCIVYITLRNPINPSFPPSSCTSLPVYLNGFYLSNVSTVFNFACVSAVGPVNIVLASQMRGPADAVKFMMNFNNSVSGPNLASLLISVYMPPGYCGVSYEADATNCAAGSFTWNNANLPGLPTSCPPPPPVSPPPPPPPFPRPPSPPTPPTPPAPPPHPTLPIAPPSPPPPRPPPPPMPIQLHMTISASVPLPSSYCDFVVQQLGSILALQTNPFFGPTCSFLSTSAIHTVTFFATDSAAESVRNVIMNQLSTFVQLLQIPCNSAITLIAPDTTNILSCPQFNAVCCTGVPLSPPPPPTSPKPSPPSPPTAAPTPSSQPLHAPPPPSSTPSPPPSPGQGSTPKPPKPRPPRPPRPSPPTSKQLPPSPPPPSSPPPSPSSSPPSSPVSSPVSMLMPPPPPPVPRINSPPPSPIVKRPPSPPTGALVINRDIVVQAPATLGGISVQYGYLQTNQCPAIKAAIASVFSFMRFYEGTDWIWFNNDPACRITPASGKGGFYYRIGLTLTTPAAEGLVAFMQDMDNRFAQLVQKAYILCLSSVDLSAGGQVLVRYTPSDAWPLQPSQSDSSHNQTCLGTPIQLGG